MGRVEGRTVTVSSRGARGRHSTSDLPATPTHLAPGFHHVYDSYLHASTIRPRIPYRSVTQEPILEFIGQQRQIGTEFFYQMFGTAPQDSSCSTPGYSHTEYGVSSFIPYVSRPADWVCEGDISFEGDRGVGEEQERVESLYIDGEADERGDDGGDDDQDEGDDVVDEEQPVPVAPVGHASGSNGHPRSRNKRPEVAHEVPTPTQKRKKVKASDWEQTETEEGGPVDPELIPSYRGHVAGSWFIKVPIALHGTHRLGTY
ncbi:hypothetical protein M9H77_13419 [Catharanthus roseus]|uniref:Uncharacterized protein n=1 Tax=Catharanthus roseus TaxID=4058 RepID=A0ACC0BK12_CATRO|nr:hypothetical protein M9H77_13419 [Catharanthus roseus]